MNRVEILKGFLEQDPKDSFSRYALALEYVKAGQTDDARREFEFVRDQIRAMLRPISSLPNSTGALGLTA